jgi:hypothetical protein
MHKNTKTRYASCHFVDYMNHEAAMRLVLRSSVRGLHQESGERYRDQQRKEQNVYHEVCSGLHSFCEHLSYTQVQGGSLVRNPCSMISVTA